MATEKTDDGNAHRTRTVSWEDPLPARARMRGLTGLEYLQKIIDEKVPGSPIGVLLDFALIEVAVGRAVFEVEPAEYHYNPIGTVHGGLAATLLDSAMSCAVQTTLPADVFYTTLEIKVNFIRPITIETGVVRCEANIVHAGKTTAIAAGKIVDRAGKLFAHGTTTCLIFS